MSFISNMFRKIRIIFGAIFAFGALGGIIALFSDSGATAEGSEVSPVLVIITTVIAIFLLKPLFSKKHRASRKYEEYESYEEPEEARVGAKFQWRGRKEKVSFPYRNQYQLVKAVKANGDFLKFENLEMTIVYKDRDKEIANEDVTVVGVRESMYGPGTYISGFTDGDEDEIINITTSKIIFAEVNKKKVDLIDYLLDLHSKQTV